jgi:hypothetical protein
MINIQKCSIGATAAIITSMGLIAGLAQAGTARASIVAGLLIIAIADNISDSFSIHIYKESEGASRRDVDSYTYGNFAARLVLVFTFILIVLLLPSYTALIVSSVWGLVLLAILSYVIAQRRKTNALRLVVWHLVVALMVIGGSRLLGSVIVRMIVQS